MKVPSLQNLKEAYEKLYFSRCSESILAEYSQWIRFDPRLGEILVSYLDQNWEEINPILFNKEILEKDWPQVTGVLLDTLKLVKKDERFVNWCNLVMSEIRPTQPYRLFFIGTYRFGGKIAKREAYFANTIYKKWGYLARDLLLSKEKLPKITLLDKKQRDTLLKDCIKNYKKVTVQMYLQLAKWQIHPRQAQRDLETNPRLQAFGNTKGRFYRTK